MTIYFGSETGTAEGIANKVADALGATAQSLEGVSVSDLSGTVLLVTSTWGDGEPPANASQFHEELLNSGSSLAGVSFAVFGIGSTGFPLFCQTAIDFDEAMVNLGAKRLVDLVKSEDESDADAWIESLKAKLS